MVEPVLALGHEDQRAADGEGGERQQQMAQEGGAAADHRRTAPAQQQRHALPDQHAVALAQDAPLRGVGAAIQRQGERDRLGDEGGGEHQDGHAVHQHRDPRRDRGPSDHAVPAQGGHHLHQQEGDGVVGLQRAGQPGHHAGGDGVVAGLALAVQPAHQQHQVGQHGGGQQVLALAELHAGQNQQQRAEHAEHRGAAGEQGGAAVQQAGRPPRRPQDDRREERVGDGLGRQAQQHRQLRRDGVEPDDQRRIDLDEVDIQALAAQPFARDIEQPGHVVLLRRAGGDHHHHRQGHGQHRQRGDAGGTPAGLRARPGTGRGRVAGVGQAHDARAVPTESSRRY